MQFGVFDHVDLNADPLGDFYRTRLKLVEKYDQLGFFSYHVAEHHFTPLGAAASPSVYLSAIAQRTKNLRFGPMVYCLPLYHPLRLAEEICMLDQLSSGRLDVGVGRGISPLESQMYGENPDVATSRQVYIESLEIICAAMKGENFSFPGDYRKAVDVNMVLSPLQKPMPPLWTGVNTEENVEFAARHGMNILGLKSAEKMRPLIDHYRKVWKQHHDASTPPRKAGISYFIVVADTDDRAKDIAARAYKRWHASFHHLYHLHGRAPVHGERPNKFSIVEDERRGIAGSPATVRAFLKQATEAAGLDYVVGQFMFGDMTTQEADASVDLFGNEIMPTFQ